MCCWQQRDILHTANQPMKGKTGPVSYIWLPHTIHILKGRPRLLKLLVSIEAMLSCQKVVLGR